MRLKVEEGWTTLLLLFAMITTSAMGVANAEFFDGLDVLPIIGVLAILAGLLLAKSRFSTRTAHIFSSLYGLFVLLFGVGAVLPGIMDWRERIFEVVNIQVVWLQKLIGGGTGREGYIFVLHTALVYWILGYFAAWYTFRKPRVWRVVVPAGLVLLSVAYYYSGPVWMSMYVATYLLLALMFVARTHLVEQEKRWRSSSVRYEPRIWLTFLRAGFVAAMVALLLAFLIPSMSASASVSDALSNARGPWREFQNNWTRLYSSLRSYGTTTIDPYQDSLVLGGPRTVGNSPVMDVYVERQLPYVYWQTIVYDTYEDGGWDVADNDATLHISDEGVFSVPFSLSRQVITQTVVNYLPNSSLLYGAPDVVGADRDVFIEASDDGNGNILMTGIRSRYVLKQGDNYRLTSQYSTADATSLRTAPLDYPEWVTETYLQMSEGITPETLALAEELTAVYDNPFDKAIAVRDYLRQNISYNDQIAATPADVDPIHYTLFVSQEAYCNYYASAMAMMLRSQGIPTRIASGYAQGEYNEDNAYYRVRASNAHTWVEVYFPDYGWIQFEPTASIPTVDRPESFDDAAGGGDAFGAFNASQNLLDREELLGEDELGDPNAEEPNLEDLLAEDLDDASLEDASVLQQIPLWQIISGFIILGGAVGVTVTANEFNKRVEGDVEKSYGRLEGWARWLGISMRTVHTPYERAEMLGTAVPEGNQSILNLTRQFVLKQFSRKQSYEDGFDPTSEWRVLRPMLIKRTFENWVERMQNRANRKK
ncbi:MAG: transglutaminase domain-containing protein [Chloroflexi bacterium]|nr:transglutaminase domain-containing protein [Chloroflexota bacterium]